MGQVIALRRTNVRQDVVEHYERMLAQARCGQVQGVIGIADLSAGGQHVITRGTFADDPDFAASVASQGFEVLLKETGRKKNGTDTLLDYVPARLRKS